MEKEFVDLTANYLKARGFENGNPLLATTINTRFDEIVSVGESTIQLRTHGLTITLSDNIGDVVIDYRNKQFVCNHPWYKVLEQAQALTGAKKGTKKKAKRTATQTMEEPDDDRKINF